MLNYSLDNFLFNRERWTQYAQTRWLLPCQNLNLTIVTKTRIFSKLIPKCGNCIESWIYLNFFIGFYLYLSSCLWDLSNVLKNIFTGKQIQYLNVNWGHEARFQFLYYATPMIFFLMHPLWIMLYISFINACVRQRWLIIYAWDSIIDFQKPINTSFMKTK